MVDDDLAVDGERGEDPRVGGRPRGGEDGRLVLIEGLHEAVGIGLRELRLRLIERGRRLCPMRHGCTHGHASIYSPSVSLPLHTMCTNTTARALHCTRSIPFHLYGCDGTRRAPVTTTQHAAYMMCTAEAPVTHSLRTDLTACPVRLNASHGSIWPPASCAG